jgi:hypothetical protein
MWRKSSQCLNLAQIVHLRSVAANSSSRQIEDISRDNYAAHLINTLKSVLHAFDRMVATVLDVLCFEDLAEGSFAFLGHESIFPHDGLLSLWRSY